VISFILKFFGTEALKRIADHVFDSDIWVSIRWHLYAVLRGLFVYLPLITVAIWGISSFYHHHYLPFFREVYLSNTFLWRTIGVMTILRAISASYFAILLIIFFGFISWLTAYKTHRDRLIETTMTLRLRDEVELKERNYRLLAAVIDLSPNLVCILDSDLIIIGVNQGYKKWIRRYGLAEDPAGNRRGFFPVFWFLSDYKNQIISAFECPRKSNIKVSVRITDETRRIEVVKQPVLHNTRVEYLITYMIELDGQ